MKAALGRDFGTTNSALAISRDGHVDVVAADENNRTGNILRSVLFFEEEINKFYVGQEAILADLPTAMWLTHVIILMYRTRLFWSL